jgi:hypothetical protein
MCILYRMPKASSKRRKREDSSQSAHRILQSVIEKTEDAEIVITDEMRAAAAAFGRIGGLKGGPARAASLSKKERSKIAKKAAATRWKK